MPTSDLDAASESLVPSSPEHRIVVYTGWDQWSFSELFSPDSNSTATGLPGPGRVLGQAFATGGQRIEAFVNRATALAGIGFQGIARRLLLKLRAPHARCRVWPALSGTSLVELAVELGNGWCTRCEKRYASTLDGGGDAELDTLLLRMMPSIESDQLGNRIEGSRFLAVMAMSHSSFHAALLGTSALRRAQVSLHQCKRLALRSIPWHDAVKTLELLIDVLDGGLPATWFNLELDQPVQYEKTPDISDHFIMVANVVKLRFHPSHPMWNVACLRRKVALITFRSWFTQLLRNEADLTQLDALYLHVLEAASLDPVTEKLDLMTCRRIRTLLGAMLLLKAPLPVSALTRLVESSEDLVIHDLLAIELILLVPVDERVDFAISGDLLHPSFSHFLVDSSRCAHLEFLVSPAAHHLELAYNCLLTLNENLKHDICGIDDPAVLNREVHDLEQRLLERVLGELRYAAIHWMTHLISGPEISPSDALCVQLLVFCKDHLLHWVKLLSLLESLPPVVSKLKQLVKWCRTHSHLAPLAEAAMLLDDAHRMLQQYMDPIRHRALQIYHSVPVMIPMCALYETMKPQRSDGFRLLSPRPPCWDFQPGIDHAHTYSANSLKWSSDGTRVITSSQDKTARIWDAQTGAHLVVLEGHEDWVHAASFSSQTTRAVTGSSDKTIRLWDVQTGRQLSAIRRDMADFWVLAVAFSPDDTQVVSGSLDGIVRVWDVVTGNEIAALSGHVHAVNSVTYLGGRLYSRSLDDTIFSWVCEGSTIEEEDRWAPTELNPISSPLTVLVWDEDSGWLSIKPGLRQSLQPLCWLPPLRRGYKFSAFGSRVAFGSEDGSLTILDLGDALEIQDGHRPHVWKDRGGEWSAALHSQLIIDAQSNVDLHRIRPHRGEMDGEKS